MNLQDFALGFVAAALLAFIATDTLLVKKSREDKYWLESIPKESIRVEGEDNFTAEVKIGIKNNKIIFVRKEVKKIP